MENNIIELSDFTEDVFNISSAPSHENNNYGLDTASLINHNQAAINPTEILFIDATVADYQNLIDNLVKQTEVILLDSQQDGIIQITESLEKYQDLAAIHIVSHGNVSELSLGDSLLNQNTLSNYQNSLNLWSDSLTETGDILLYGCNVAGDATGQEFVRSLSQYTMADIVASNDLTGNAELGGDWDLEYAVGEIDTELAFNTEVNTNYEQILFDGFSFSPPPGGYNNDFGFDSGFDDFRIDDQYTFEPYDPFDYDLDFDFGFDNFIGYSDFDDDSDSGFDLDRYDFSNPQINSDVLNFTPTKIDFNPNDFDFNSLSLSTDSISFQFEPAQFNAISSKLEVLSQVSSNNELKLAFEDYNFNFNSLFSFESDQVTIGTTGSNTITFNYDPGSFDFTGGELFRVNANLFDYKFLDSDISLIHGDIPFVEYNASDFRALEYAFVGDELFDPEYYLANNVIAEGNNPFTDYIENGYQAGRNPNSLFDVNYYLSQNDDIRIAGIDPLEHYARVGYTEDHENRDPSAVFDSSYYNQNNPDVVDAEMPSLLHYILFGNSENLDSRDPNPVFDNSYYNQMNPDVAQSGMTALEHYLLFGWKESRPDHPNYNPNRNPNAFLNSTDYFILNSDVLAASYQLDSANPLQHLLEFGSAENRLTHKLLETEYIAKFTKTITPKSAPQDILNAQQDFNRANLSLTTKEDGTFEISQITPIDDVLNPYTAAAVTLYVLVGSAIILRDTFNNLDSSSEFEFDNSSSLSGYSVTPSEASSTDVITIDYTNPELEDLLSGTRAFPGQTESERQIEIFLPPEVDGVEDYTIFPEDSGIFIPTTTTFPKNDPIIEDILNDGLFLGGEEIPQGAYVLPIETNPFAAVDKRITIDKGTVRELKVAQIVGGFKVVEPGRPNKDLAVRERNNRNIGLAVDVIGANNELILVGGANKADNLDLITQRTRTLKRVADSYGVAALAYFAEGTPQEAIDRAAAELDDGNVRTFTDVTSEDFSNLPQLKIIKDKIDF